VEGGVVKSIGDVLTDMGWPDRLRDIAQGIRTNVPRPSNPDAFHERKSELEERAMVLADEIETHVRNSGGHR